MDFYYIDIAYSSNIKEYIANRGNFLYKGSSTVNICKQTNEQRQESIEVAFKVTFACVVFLFVYFRCVVRSLH